MAEEGYPEGPYAAEEPHSEEEHRPYVEHYSGATVQGVCLQAFDIKTTNGPKSE